MGKSYNDIINNTLPPYSIYKNMGAPEAAGIVQTSFFVNDMPPKSNALDVGITGYALDSSVSEITGGIPFPNLPSNEIYLSRFSCATNGPANYNVFLCDRLWHNSGIVVTSLKDQTINSCDWPNRCVPSDYSNTPNNSGFGVYVAIEVVTGTTNASAITNMVLTYTNSDGVSGRVSTCPSYAATATGNSMYIFPLISGDVGVKSIQTLNLGTSLVYGCVSLCAFRIIEIMAPAYYHGINMLINPLSGGLPRFFTGSVPYILGIPNTATGPIVFSQIEFTTN